MYMRITCSDGFFLEKNLATGTEWCLDTLIEKHGPIVDLFVDTGM